MRLKICCIQNLTEAQLAINAGATEIGLVGKMPSGPGPINDAQIKEIAENVAHEINTVLLSSESNADKLIAHVKRVGTNSLQIVREVPIATLEKIKSTHPEINIFQVVHVTDQYAIDRAIEYSQIADNILLDSGTPQAAILGGTGKTHNWDISRRIVENVTVPVFLAGGLNPNNINAAIDSVHPAGIDVCSGLRQDDALNAKKLAEFAKIVLSK